MAAVIPLLLGAAALAALLGGRKSSASSSSSSSPAAPGEQVPIAVRTRMATALATNDPAAIRAEASKLQSEGYALPAAELLRVADEVSSGSATVRPLAKRPAAGAAAAGKRRIVSPAPKTAAAAASPAASAARAAADAPLPASSSPLAAVAKAAASPFPPPAPLPSPGVKVLDSVPDPAPHARTLSYDEKAKKGSKGADVASWQRILKGFGYDIGSGGPQHDGVDSDFGPTMQRATKQFQSDSLALYKDPRIEVDGKVGPITRKLVTLRTRKTPAVSGDGDDAEAEPAPAAATTPNVSLPDSPLPGVVAPAVDTTPIPADRLLAGRLAAHLLDTPSGKEDSTLIRRFQAQEGLKETGQYGPGTAAKLIDYGIVPPWPRAWSKTGRNNLRRRYRALLLEQAAGDPARADEWQAAALGKGLAP